MKETKASERIQCLMKSLRNGGLHSACRWRIRHGPRIRRVKPCRRDDQVIIRAGRRARSCPPVSAVTPSLARCDLEMEGHVVSDAFLHRQGARLLDHEENGRAVAVRAASS